MANILNLISEAGCFDLDEALRAVVELHQPYEHEVVDYVFCKACAMDPVLAPSYPCLTIQTIEKQLTK